MNLVGYTATALSRNDIEDTPTNKNVVDFAIVELKDLQGNLVVMYDDAEGLNPETQKICDTDGQRTFFAEVGDYVLEINGKAQRINLSSGLASFISTKTDESAQDFIDSFALKIFQSPTGGGLTEIQTRTIEAGEVYEVRKTSDNSLATIYSNAAGTTEIVQNGTDNKSGSDGVVEFYIEDTFEELKIEIGASSAKFKNNVFIQQHTREQGIGVWDADTTYPVDALVKGGDGRLYFSVSEQNNNDPTLDGGSNWVKSPITSGANFSNSVADMKATKYKNNILVVTKSFHNISIEDTKGSSLYLILSSSDYSGTPDEVIDHTLDNGNIAKLLHYDKANLYQLGARDDSLNDVSILNSAFSELESLCIPDEDFEFEGSVQLNKEGFSMYSSSGTLTHRPTAINQPFIEVTSDDVSIRGISFFGLGSRAVNRQPVTLLFANCILLQGNNCSGLEVVSCNFEQNAHGVKLVGCSSSKITNCNSKFTASYCYHLSGCKDIMVMGNYAEGSGTDGFKTTDQNTRLIIDSNISVGHRRDGFDLFDGFQQSVLSNNISKDNYLNGFECKGTASVDYNFRDSTVIGNLAQGNNTDPTVVVGSQTGAGFAVVSVRGATFTGNISTENINMGWIIENCQEDIFNGNSSNKNGAHGYYIGPSANVSRTSLVGNQAYDNSADSTNTYDGFHFGVQAFCNVIACESHKGTSGSNNDQRYGYGFTSGANISLISCHASSNTSGDLGGNSGNSKLVMLPNWTQQDWTRSNFSTNRSVDASTATTQQLANAFCTLLSDLEDLGYIK